MKVLMRFDTFRRLDADLHEGTYHGALITLMTWLFMIYLMFNEITTIFFGEYSTEVLLDDNMEDDIYISFDITMLELPCRFVEVNVWDIFEDYQINITKGIKQRRNWVWVNDVLVPTSELLHEDTVMEHDYIELDREGNHAIDLEPVDGRTIEQVFQKHIDDYNVLIVNFYASWCGWSKRFKPVFEKAAVEIDVMKWEYSDVRVKLVAVACDKHDDLCDHWGIGSYPTILYIRRGEKHTKYSGHRTVKEIVKWTLSMARAFNQDLPMDLGHGACQLVGRVHVPRVPGVLVIEAGSKHHSLSPSMTNVSHRIHHLSFGPNIDPGQLGLPKSAISSYNPLDNMEFIAKKLHTAPSHYIYVVPNMYSQRGLLSGRSVKSVQAYQMTISNKLKEYENGAIPEAKFTYKFSNIMLDHANRGQGLYHVLTNFCAIIGGTYAFMQLTNSLMSRLVLTKRTSRKLIK